MNKNKTTIVADNDLLLELRTIAQKRGVSFSEVVRCALQDYVGRNAPARSQLSFAGAGASGGRLNLGERAEGLLFHRRRGRRA